MQMTDWGILPQITKHHLNPCPASAGPNSNKQVLYFAAIAVPALCRLSCFVPGSNSVEFHASVNSAMVAVLVEGFFLSLPCIYAHTFPSQAFALFPCSSPYGLSGRYQLCWGNPIYWHCGIYDRHLWGLLIS